MMQTKRAIYSNLDNADGLLKLSKLEQLQRPWVVAHRGFRGKYPENTLAAFEAAVSVGADMIELDVCLSRDRVPVVIHDKTLNRTTDGKGLVSGHTLSELKKLDAGSRFAERFKGERIPTLEEVLQQIKGRITVNIEIKPESFESPAPADAVELQVCELLDKLGMEDSVLISSFEHFFFPRIRRWHRKYSKAIAAGASGSLRIAPLQETFLPDEAVVSLCQRQSAYSYHPDQNLVTPALIQILKSEGLRIFPYTVNNAKQMKQLIQWGVSGIITDEPEMLRQVLVSR